MKVALIILAVAFALAALALGGTLLGWWVYCQGAHAHNLIC